MRATRVIAACAVLALAGAALARADGVRYLDEVFASVERTDDLLYGAGDPFVFDLYEPAGDTAPVRHAIVLAPGGGFTTAEEDGLAPLATAFARRGYVVFAIDYRVDPDLGYDELITGSLAGTMPDAMRNAQLDMQAAVRFARANAGTYGIDPGTIVAGGVSAGASMALETAFNPTDDGDDGVTPSDVAAAVAISGATDPRRIEPGAPPVRMMNGVLDTTAPFLTAIMACGGTTAMGNVCELKPYPTSGHDLGAHLAEMVAESAAFLCANAYGGCA